VSLFEVCYLTTVTVSGLYGIDDKMINEYGIVGGMRIGRENRSKKVNLSPCLTN
jgi:hypothetical protein